MKNNKKSITGIFISLAVLVLFGVSFVSAFSVSSPYMENNTLNILLDSKTTNLEFVLQNGGGATEDINVKVNILDGEDIISIIDEDNIYSVSPGDKVPVNFRIVLPEEVESGNVYNIRLEFITVTSGQSGEFKLGTGQEQSFKVLVGEESLKKKTNSPWIYITLGILIIALVIAILLVKRKNSNPPRKK
jgi:uncharacterized membrane protein